MPIWPALSRARMRPADPPDPDFHLLEELAKPPACLTAGRICCWVYHDVSGIREIVLSGHAEHSTCSRVSSSLIETVRTLDGSVTWMVTCGAAHFRVEVPSARAQEALGAAVADLRETADDTGLVQVVDADWRSLEEFRRGLASRAGASPPLVVLPGRPGAGGVADYVPLLPEVDPGGGPLVFRLEGWDYDCPKFQAVAHLHLRSMNRELLRDALRRRLVYRGWLKEWTEEWIRRVHGLPEGQALAIRVRVPAPPEPPGLPEAELDVIGFLQALPAFLDKSQTWPLRMEQAHRFAGYGQFSERELDEPHWPKFIVEVDYHRGIKSERPSRPTDPPFTWRQRIRMQEPALITDCLRYIRRMDEIIRPYEDMETRLAGGGGPEHKQSGAAGKVAVVGEISRRIVIETMIRGWPSFYLDDDRDRAVFDAWARRCRPRAWAVLARQARSRGVALDPLLEDNVVYDVGFDADLGCIFKPLVLVDDAAHAQVHGGRVGASAFVPLWTRRTSRPQGGEVIALGERNSERARRLVETAAQQATGPMASPQEAARLLRAALACHPGEAGNHILREWARRLGRNTETEFQQASLLIEARELCLRHRYKEARPSIGAHLAAEPRPVPDALVLAALCELLADWDLPSQLEKLQKAEEEHNALVPQYKQLVEQARSLHGTAVDPLRLLEHQLATSLDEREVLSFRGIMQLLELPGRLEELNRARQRCDDLARQIEDRRKKAADEIRQALAKPHAVRAQRPALARAAAEAPAELKATLAKESFLRPDASDDFLHRYGGVWRILRIRKTMEILYELGLVRSRIDHDPQGDHRIDAQGLERLSRSVWLPGHLTDDLEVVIQEIRRGAGDRLLARNLMAVLDRSMMACLAEIHDRMSDAAAAATPFGETLITQIHVLQTLDRRYRIALQDMLGARVAVARLVLVPWTVLDDERTGLPPGARFRYEAGTGTVFVESEEGSLPLLRAERTGPEVDEHLASVLGDPDLPARIDPLAVSLAQGLLCAEVEPCRHWQLWRDAMKVVTPELLHALSGFSYRACLLPNLAPSLNEAGRRMEEKLETIVPRDEPAIDWSWNDPGRWRQLLGRNARKTFLNEA